MDKYVYGADTETIHGKPMTLQFYSEDIACEDMYFVNEDTALPTFIKWCAQRKKNVQHVVYVHKLDFDLVEFLWGRHELLAHTEFDFKYGKARISGVYGTPTFARIQFGNGVSILFVDSFSYFRESLAKASLRVCPDLPKLRRVDGLGEKLFTKRDSGFCDYAMRDAVVAYHLGKSIEGLHQEFDLTQCVSVADMAARVFKHKFLDYEIPQPSRDIVERALLSYHGGKNNVTVESGWYEDTTSIDISSAFPESMHAMPSFSNGKAYKAFRAGNGVRRVPDYGVYAVSGRADACPWPCVFSHSFKPLSGDIDRVWMQGFELNEALSSGELRASRINGYFYDVARDNQAPALRAYVDFFYERKESAENPVNRFMYKLLLNSLYGKFIQTRKRGSIAYTDIDSGDTTTAADLIAGGMFHPFIASAITAKPRARIHRLEHEYQALHTATDGVFTQRRVTRGANFDLQPGKGKTRLGSLTVEAEKATLLLLRNKTYVLYAAKGPKTTPSVVFKGRHIRKFALHGFQGSVTDLERLAATGKRTYTVKRANRLKESVKRKLTPNDFVTKQFTLRVGPLAVNKPRRRVRQSRHRPRAG